MKSRIGLERVEAAVRQPQVEAGQRGARARTRCPTRPPPRPCRGRRAAAAPPQPSTPSASAAASTARRSASSAPQRRLRGGQARDRHAEGRARYVVEPDARAEAHAARIAAVLAAEPELEPGPRARGPCARRSRSARRCPARRSRRRDRRAGSPTRCTPAGSGRRRRARARSPSASGRWCRSRRSPRPARSRRR